MLWQEIIARQKMSAHQHMVAWREMFTAWESLAALLPENSDWAVGSLTILLLLLLARLAGWSRRRILARQFLQLVRDTHSHPIQVHLGPDAQGFVAESNPPPDPFDQLMILYSPSSRLDPIGFLRWIVGRHVQTLRVRAMLRRKPAAELFWLRGAKPAALLLRMADGHTWLQRSLDFSDVQYGTRGIDTAAIEHVFAEFQTRFGPNLQKFVVRGEAQPHIEIVLAAPRLDPLQVAGCLISLRSVGRAASY